MKKRFKLLNEFKTALPLMSAERIVFHFPHENGGNLEKSTCTIVDHEKGLVDLELSDFEVQGLMLGENQNCGCKVYMQNGDEYTILFSQAINVQMKNERKVWV